MAMKTSTLRPPTTTRLNDSPSRPGEPVNKRAQLTLGGTKTAKNKRTGYALGGALLLGISALTGITLLNQQTKTRAIIVTNTAIQAGTTISPEMLRIEQVNADLQINSLPLEELENVIGHTTERFMGANTVITSADTNRQIEPPLGTVLVGLALEAGAIPTQDLRHGDHVEIIATPNTQDNPSGSLTTATVWSIWNTSNTTTLNSPSGKRTITLAVPEAHRIEVVQAIARNEIRLAILPNTPANAQPLAPASELASGEQPETVAPQDGQTETPIAGLDVNGNAVAGTDSNGNAAAGASAAGADVNGDSGPETANTAGQVGNASAAAATNGAAS